MRGKESHISLTICSLIFHNLQGVPGKAFFSIFLVRCSLVDSDSSCFPSHRNDAGPPPSSMRSLRLSDPHNNVTRIYCKHVTTLWTHVRILDAITFSNFPRG